MDTDENKIVNEILKKCEKKGIKVRYILKVNHNSYKKEMDYFIGPVIEDENEIRFGCMQGYGYKSNSILIRLKKTSIGSGHFLNSHKDEFPEVYFDEKVGLH